MHIYSDIDGIGRHDGGYIIRQCIIKQEHRNFEVCFSIAEDQTQNLVHAIEEEIRWDQIDNSCDKRSSNK
jgi:hypothetical protein